MSFVDLDLEFEDEEEAKKKKQNEAVHIEGELDFHAREAAAKTRTGIKLDTIKAAPPAVPVKESRPQPQQAPVAVVKKIEEARPSQPVAKKAPAVVQPAPRIVGSSALKEEPDYDFEGQEVMELREKVRNVEIQSEIRVGIAEFKTEYITEVMSDMKLLDHQVNQLLLRINAKHPDVKQEVLMIKKLLADFTAKKRK